jgi:glycosyltransferase involved in cell wall biosynthesis
MNKKPTQRPFVSVICPTYNRTNFLPYLIHQFNYQTYPQQYMELIILDDSDISNKNIIPIQDNIRYIHLKKRMFTSQKRNMLNNLAKKKADIIVCFDDDDYYSPERVSHAVDKLNKSPNCLIAASSIIHIYYIQENKILEFGPYGKYHGTNGTFAYKVKYLENHSYQNDRIMAEESYFTNNFSEPLVQLDPYKVMICLAHNNNTVNKQQFYDINKEIKIKINKFFKINDNKMLKWIDELKTIIPKKPFVSVICPTYNRKKFLPYLIHQFNYQTYPQESMELIILDDSTESNNDLIPEQENIKYIYSNEKILLGKKRNMLNNMAKGNIIVCFDDDDYYSPERVEYSVSMLSNTQVLIAGCTIINVYYTKQKHFLTFGPYHQNHATNGTFAYKREYLINHHYEDDKTMAEELFFTNSFSEPLLQLDPRKIIICLAHQSNTVDKDKFINVGKQQDIGLENFFYKNDIKMLEWINELQM